MGPIQSAHQGIGLLRSALAGAPPAQVGGASAAAMAAVFAEAERVAAAAKALYAHRVAEVGAYEVGGHHDPARWLAKVSGDPVGKARGTLEMVDAVAQNPAVEEAFAKGELSVAQAQVIGGAAAANPAAAGDLLEAARNDSFRELKELANRAKRRARSEDDEVARERRVHGRRYCRTWEPEGGGLRIEALLTKVDGARLLAKLEGETDRVFEEARGLGEREEHDRYRADALVRLVCGEGSGVAAHMVVRVDAAALRRGSLEAGEVCEIPGVGQVSVATARGLLGEAFFNVVVTDGIDIHTVSSGKRTIPRALRVALVERDPTCVVPGCPASNHLQIDHWQLDFAKRGPTSLDNLCRLCPRHHAMKTQGGWRLKGGPGRWRWVGPALPRPRPLRT